MIVLLLLVLSLVLFRLIDRQKNRPALRERRQFDRKLSGLCEQRRIRILCLAGADIRNPAVLPCVDQIKNDCRPETGILTASLVGF